MDARSNKGMNRWMREQRLRNGFSAGSSEENQPTGHRFINQWMREVSVHNRVMVDSRTNKIIPWEIGGKIDDEQGS